MARSTTTSTTLPFLLLLLSSSLLTVALGSEIRITDAQGLIELSNNVTSGTNYSGTTVLLDSDIDFAGGYSERFAPIGDYDYFLGTFDGQGHTISNLKVNSSSRCIGLFGISLGTTIQNVVIDGSCSFASSYSSGDSSVGNIIGYCYSFDGPCTIESVVNMGSVLFEGNTTGSLNIGGIAGEVSSSSKYPSTLKNCVNYGSVTHSGGNFVEMGGIVGKGMDSQHHIFPYRTASTTGQSHITEHHHILPLVVFLGTVCTRPSRTVSAQVLFHRTKRARTLEGLLEVSQITARSRTASGQVMLGT